MFLIASEDLVEFNIILFVIVLTAYFISLLAPYSGESISHRGFLMSPTSESSRELFSNIEVNGSIHAEPSWESIVSSSPNPKFPLKSWTNALISSINATLYVGNIPSNLP